jgi:hypothetical protein
MSFFTDIVDYLSGANKTHEELNSFVNKRFNYFLNNSNLLLNFVSDFEDYKSGNLPNGKSKCNECEDLFILTNDIFEKYFNKISIPYNIETSEGESKTNYKDKVLYFFDLKDLKKILAAENLEKSSSDPTHFNKKRLLCKIISLSFIKIYIIVKSIFQTFNIYNSLVSNGDTDVYRSNNYESSGYKPPYEALPYKAPTYEAPTYEAPTYEANTLVMQDKKNTNPLEDTEPDENTKNYEPNGPYEDTKTDTPAITAEDAKTTEEAKTAEEDKPTEQANPTQEANPSEDAKLKQQDGGGFLSNIYDKLVGNKKEISNPVNETISNEDIDVTSTSSCGTTAVVIVVIVVIVHVLLCEVE